VELAEREQVIDALYLEIENLASREILLQAPVAADLRFLLSPSRCPAAASRSARRAALPRLAWRVQTLRSSPLSRRANSRRSVDGYGGGRDDGDRLRGFQLPVLVPGQPAG
jgi:hypothetical protein